MSTVKKSLTSSHAALRPQAVTYPVQVCYLLYICLPCITSASITAHEYGLLSLVHKLARPTSSGHLLIMTSLAVMVPPARFIFILPCTVPRCVATSTTRAVVARSPTSSTSAPTTTPTRPASAAVLGWAGCRRGSDGSALVAGEFVSLEDLGFVRLINHSVWIPLGNSGTYVSLEHDAPTFDLLVAPA